MICPEGYSLSRPIRGERGGGLRPKGISLVEVYERVGKAVVSVVKRPKWLTDAFYGCKNVGKRSGFVIFSYCKDSS